MEPRIVATAGMALTFLPVLSLAFINYDTSIYVIAVSLLVLGLGLSLFTSPNTNAIMSSIERRCYGVGSATLGTMRLVGQVLSMGIAMLVFSVYLGKVEILPENYPQFVDSVQVAFAISAGLCFLGIFASMARGSLREKDGEAAGKTAK
jgi:MFS family permease